MDFSGGKKNLEGQENGIIYIESAAWKKLPTKAYPANCPEMREKLKSSLSGEKNREFITTRPVL
jgi:hypothetical protein